MNVLSLFDGMSCGQIALERAGIKVDNYFASEIDKHAIKVTLANYPNTIQVGSVVDLESYLFPEIDLLIGGSPCQGFSFAGKQLAFDDPRSKLFFEYVRLLKGLKPKYFLLENVRMKKEYQNIISEYLGVEPIRINSALLSAQNRDRFYWTNIPGVTQPDDKGIMLKDITEDKELYFGAAQRGRNIVDGKRKDYTGAPTVQRIETNFLQKSNCLTSVQKDTLVLQINASKECAGTQPSIQNRIYHTDFKSPSLLAQMSGSVYKISDSFFVRKLTPVECERLQTVPDNYTNHVSSTQRYKMLGNGWTVDVIAHILKHIA